MSELRFNQISQEWVIIATDRAKRPQDFIKPAEERIVLPQYKPDCPFCPGNEAKTPRESFRLGDEKAWRVRVAANKFPALSPQEKQKRSLDGMFWSLSGYGVHEVIIEHPKHNMLIPLMSVNEVRDIIQTYKDRSQAIQQVPGIESIVIFKNHGAKAGTSLEHPHSQIIATPIIPPQLRKRITQAMQYFDQTGKCVFCQTLAEELRAGSRIVFESEHFVSFSPYAALSPFHLWIFPRRHDASFAGIAENEAGDLAGNLKDTLSRLYYGLDNPDLNVTIHSTPIHENSPDYFHWYISIIPRISNVAGFELGSGMFINTALPEQSAEFLRAVKSA